MADPVASVAVAKKLLAFGERALKQGLRIVPEEMDDLQPFIDQPDLMQRLVCHMQAIVAFLPFTEPESHQKARAIMGEKNFHGLFAAQKCFGPYTAQELEQHMPLRLCDVNGNPFTNSDEETLAICEECKGTHILVALQSLSLPGIHAKCKERMANDKNVPWFGEQRQRGWASQVIKGTWLLIRKEVVPKSWSKSQTAQKEYVKLTLPKERLTLPAEHSYVALLHQQETGEQLCRGYWVRFPVQVASGDWVSAGWHGEHLVVSGLDDEAIDSIASGTVRTS